MKVVPLPFPYLPQLIQLAVLTSVLALFGVLFITIGVVTQGCRSFSRTNPRHAEAFAAGIDRGTQCAGDQHQNLFASLSSFLDDPASFLSCRVNLEFASSQRSSHGRSSSLHRLRRYPVFAPSDQVLAFVLSNLCLRTAFSRPDTRDMPG